MNNKKVTINELGITVTYQVRFSGEVTEKVAQQLQSMYKKEMVYSEDNDPLTNHSYKQAIELVADVGYNGVPSHYTYEIDSLEFSDESEGQSLKQLQYERQSKRKNHKSLRTRKTRHSRRTTISRENAKKTT